MLTFAPMNGKDEIRKNEQIYFDSEVCRFVV